MESSSGYGRFLLVLSLLLDGVTTSAQVTFEFFASVAKKCARKFSTNCQPAKNVVSADFVSDCKVLHTQYVRMLVIYFYLATVKC